MTNSLELIDLALSRSWLLRSAQHTDHYVDADDLHADQVIYDLEDGVTPDAKADSRDRVLRWLRTGRPAWVRINDATTDWWDEDLRTLRSTDGLTGVMLAKTEHPEQVQATVHRLGGTTPVIALIESAAGIEAAAAIAQVPGVARLAFGSGDYRRDTGAHATAAAMAYPRARLVVASRLGGLPGPIDGPTVPATPHTVRAGCDDAIEQGMTGKLVLHPGGVALVNDAFSPAADDIGRATTFLAEHEARGGAIRDGSDLPRLGWATQIRQRAEAFGLLQRTRDDA